MFVAITCEGNLKNLEHILIKLFCLAIGRTVTSINCGRKMLTALAPGMFITMLEN
jgi:hypothetical protein